MLQLRTVANTLLACAAHSVNCQPFLKKYYRKCVQLPSDMLEVGDLYRKLSSTPNKAVHLPVCLRKVMVEKFADFDEYQLAKYNKANRPSRKRKKLLAATTSKSAFFCIEDL